MSLSLWNFQNSKLLVNLETSKWHDFVVTYILFNFSIFQLLAILKLLYNCFPSSLSLKIILRNGTSHLMCIWLCTIWTWLWELMSQVSPLIWALQMKDPFMRNWSTPITVVWWWWNTLWINLSKNVCQRRKGPKTFWNMWRSIIPRLIRQKWQLTWSFSQPTCMME